MANSGTTCANEYRLSLSEKTSGKHEIVIKTEEDKHKRHLVKTISWEGKDRTDRPDCRVLENGDVRHPPNLSFKEEDEIIAIDGVLVAGSYPHILEEVVSGRYVEERLVFIIRRKSEKFPDTITWDFYEIEVLIIKGRGLDDLSMNIMHLRHLTLSLLDLSQVTGVKFNSDATEVKKICFPLGDCYLEVDNGKLGLAQLPLYKNENFEFHIYTFTVTGLESYNSDKCESLTSVYVLQNISSRSFVQCKVRTKEVALKSCYDGISYRDWTKPDSRFFNIVEQENKKCYFESIKSRGLFLGCINGKLKFLSRRKLGWNKKEDPPATILFQCFGNE